MISIIGLRQGKEIKPFKYVVSYSIPDSEILQHDSIGMMKHKKFRNKQISFAYMQLKNGQLSQLSLYQICRPKFQISRKILTVLNFRN